MYCIWKLLEDTVKAWWSWVKLIITNFPFSKLFQTGISSQLHCITNHMYLNMANTKNRTVNLHYWQFYVNLLWQSRNLLPSAYFFVKCFMFCEHKCLWYSHRSNLYFCSKLQTFLMSSFIMWLYHICMYYSLGTLVFVYKSIDYFFLHLFHWINIYILSI